MTTLSVESEPMETLKELIVSHWKPTQDFPIPDIQVVNNQEDAVARVDFSTGDSFSLSQPSPEQIRQRGNFQYYDKTLPIEIDIVSADSRQRVRNLWKMTRAILMDNKHNFEGYQLIKILSYQELVSNLNIWRVRIMISVEAGGVPSDTITG